MLSILNNNFILIATLMGFSLFLGFWCAGPHSLCFLPCKWLIASWFPKVQNFLIGIIDSLEKYIYPRIYVYLYTYKHM